MRHPELASGGGTVRVFLHTGVPQDEVPRGQFVDTFNTRSVFTL